LCGVSVFPRTPQTCENRSTVYKVLDPGSVALNHCGYSHIEVCNDPVQHLMWNSLDLRSNVILKLINSLGIVSIESICATDPVT